MSTNPFEAEPKKTSDLGSEELEKDPRKGLFIEDDDSIKTAEEKEEEMKKKHEDPNWYREQK